MPTSDTNMNTFENISSTESASRVLSGTVAIAAAATSGIINTIFFGPVLVFGIVLIMTGIIGWDPIRALIPKKSVYQQLFDYHQKLNSIK